jgi:hypothetical protein
MKTKGKHMSAVVESDKTLPYVSSLLGTVREILAFAITEAQDGANDDIRKKLETLLNATVGIQYDIVERQHALKGGKSECCHS